VCFLHNAAYFLPFAAILQTGSRRDQRASSLHKQSASFQIPKLSLMTAVRGHHIEVYCVVWDRRSNRFATGSDDKLVKIWCAQTGLLLSTCRGHDGEVILPCSPHS
jgi:WD40 repeat protein